MKKDSRHQGRIVAENYRIWWAKKPQIVIVNKLREEENNMDIKRTGLIGRSKDEENRDYILPPGLIENKYGGVKHQVGEYYKYPSLDRKGVEPLRKYNNYVMLEETDRLGEKMGLKRDLLKGSSPVPLMINLPQ